MATGPSRHGFVVRALVATALGASSLGAATTARAGGPLDPLLCAVTRLLEPVPLADALTSGVSAALVRAQNQLTADQLDHLAEDDTTWLDECARVFVVDEAASPTERATVDQAPAGGVPGDVFDLSSRPGSNLTIHLDFDARSRSLCRVGVGGAGLVVLGL